MKLGGLFFAIFYKHNLLQMKFKKFFLLNLFILLNIIGAKNSIADNHNIYETLELIQKDIKTLEKAVYSGSIEVKNNSSNFDNNSEDVLTRHLLKLSEIENQFQLLTNKFEEINFKLDKFVVLLVSTEPE